MKVNVIDGLGAVLTAVGDDAEAVAQFLFLGNLGDDLEDMGDRCAVFGRDVGGGIGDVGLGDDQNMNRRHRVDVLEGEDGFVLIDLGGGNIALCDFAE